MNKEGETADAWILTAGVQAGILTYVHSALQRRADSSHDTAEDFRDSPADGNGWGIYFSAQKGKGAFIVDFLRSDYEYKLNYPNGFHNIQSNRTDFEAYWRQTTGTNANGHWGWHAGLKWLGEAVDVTIKENKAQISGNDDVNWLMLKTGYYGELTPWGGDFITAHGSASLLIGEVRGLARVEGSDTNTNDGKISEKYDSEFSLGYGASVLGGLTFHIVDQLNVKLEYRREWLYSFEATQSGIVVFPDNDDALFISNTHGVYIYLNYVW
jgi:hypothetical protein